MPCMCVCALPCPLPGLLPLAFPLYLLTLLLLWVPALHCLSSLTPFNIYHPVPICAIATLLFPTHAIVACLLPTCLCLPTPRTLITCTFPSFCGLPFTLYTRFIAVASAHPWFSLTPTSCVPYALDLTLCTPCMGYLPMPNPHCVIYLLSPWTVCPLLPRFVTHLHCFLYPPMILCSPLFYIMGLGQWDKAGWDFALLCGLTCCPIVFITLPSC